MIRYCAPAQWFARTVRKPFTIHDTTIKPASGSSHCSRRPTATNASTPIPTSSSGTGPSSGSLAFGRGQHFCLGVHLARLEIAIMVDRMAQAGAGLPDRRRGRVPAAVEFPVGLEQHPGGGLRMWSYRLVAPYTFERTSMPDKTPDGLGTDRCCCGSWPRGCAAATCPPFGGARQDSRRHRHQRRRDGRVPDPRGRR